MLHDLTIRLVNATKKLHNWAVDLHLAKMDAKAEFASLRIERCKSRLAVHNNRLRILRAEFETAEAACIAAVASAPYERIK